jgi:protein SCO1/2
VGMKCLRRGLAAGIAAALVVIAAGCGGRSSEPPAPARAASAAVRQGGFRGTPALGASVAADFALRDQDGNVVRLSAQRGRFVLLTFLYTHCPDVCPLLASNLNLALRELTRSQRDNVRVIAVSVDPRGDTRSAVRRFAEEHRLLPEFHYVIGSRSELKPIWQAYNLLVEVGNSELVSHSTYVLLLDRKGKPRLFYTSHVGAADVLHDLRRVLRAS